MFFCGELRALAAVVVHLTTALRLQNEKKVGSFRRRVLQLRHSESLFYVPLVALHGLFVLTFIFAEIFFLCQDKVGAYFSRGASCEGAGVT
mmetsp:Transcript_15843/g.21879  ORF Transcript_15843/g.21879 Transcript_15843/m.21879 type:complete len:91 (+) Transcript_15843:144-416(+)